MMRIFQPVISVICFVAISIPNEASAQAPQTCGDLGWGAWPKNNQVSINSKNAVQSSKVDSLDVLVEQRKKLAFLSCDTNLLNGIKAPATWGATSRADLFKQKIASALTSTSTKRLAIAQSIYLTNLFPLSTGAQGYNTPSGTWRVEQAKLWCETQDKTIDPDTINIPKNLPTLGAGVKELNPRAIALSWQVAQEFSSRDLKEGCNANLKRFIESLKL